MREPQAFLVSGIHAAYAHLVNRRERQQFLVGSAAVQAYGAHRSPKRHTAQIFRDALVAALHVSTGLGANHPSTHRRTDAPRHRRADARGRRGLSDAIDVQAVNAYHQRFKGCLPGFRGATLRYLPVYPSRRCALDGRPVSSPKQLLRTAIGVIGRKR